MKNIFVKDLKRYLEKEVRELFLLRDVRFSQTNGQKWQDLYLVDISGRMIGKCWSEHMDERYFDYVGMVVRVTGKVELFRDVYGMRISNVEPATPADYEPADFRIGADEKLRGEMISELQNLIAQVENPEYRALLEATFTKSRVNKLLELPGDAKYHHVYAGGWMKHALETAKIALSCAEMCSGIAGMDTKADRDLLIAGGLLHDIGAVSSYKVYSLEPYLSLRGEMVGAVIDGSILLAILNNRVAQEKRVEDLTELLHIIGAAHEESTKAPLTKEALIVASADKMSNQLASYDQLFYDHDHSKPEDAGKTKVYSQYFDRPMIRKAVKGKEAGSWQR